MGDVECYGRLLLSEQDQPPQIAIMHDEAAAVDRAMQRPAEIDAVLVFDHAGGRVGRYRGGVWDIGGGKTGGRREKGVGPLNWSDEVQEEDGQQSDWASFGGLPSLANSLYSYSIRMNHTDMPPTEFIYDFFDPVPDPFRQNGLMLYKRCVCTCVCVCVCVCVRARAYVHTSTLLCRSMRCACMRVCVLVCMRVCVFVCMCVYACVCVYVRVCMRICVCLYACICMFLCVHTFV